MNDECKQMLCNEWYEIKVLDKEKKLNELLDLALANDNRFPTVGVLLFTLSLLPVSTVCRERGFRRTNLVENNFISSLQPQILSELMMIKMSGPSLTEFNREKAVDQWFLSSKTSRHVNGHKRPNKK
jgi:hypothetical protein